MANKKSKKVPYDVIAEAANGNPEAMAAVVRHYRGYMAALGIKYHDMNTETQGCMETRLMLAILQFKVKSDTD